MSKKRVIQAGSAVNHRWRKGRRLPMWYVPFGIKVTLPDGTRKLRTHAGVARTKLHEKEHAKLRYIMSSCQIITMLELEIS